MGLWTDKDSAFREGQYAHGAEVRKEKGDRNEKLNQMVEQMRGDNQFRTANLNAEVQREDLAAKKPVLDAQANSINTETGINKAKGEFETQEAPGMLKLLKEGLSMDTKTKRGALMANTEKFFKDSGMDVNSMPGFMEGLYGEDYKSYVKGKVKPVIDPTAPGVPTPEVAKPTPSALTPSTTEQGPKRNWLMRGAREVSRFGLPLMGAATANILASPALIPTAGTSSIPATLAGGAIGALGDSMLWGEKKTLGQAAMTAVEGSVAGAGGGAYKPGILKSSLKGVGEFFTGGAAKKAGRVAEVSPRWLAKNKDVYDTMLTDKTLPRRWKRSTLDMLKRRANDPNFPQKYTRE